MGIIEEAQKTYDDLILQLNALTWRLEFIECWVAPNGKPAMTEELTRLSLDYEATCFAAEYAREALALAYQNRPTLWSRLGDDPHEQ